jgi:hypothetical protein
MTVLVDTTI